MSKVINKSTSINIRLDTETRRQLQEFADQLGIPATALAVANIKQMLRSGEVRFAPSLEPTPYLKKLITQAEHDLETDTGITTLRSKADIDEFFSSL